MPDLSKWGPATVLVVTLVLLVTLVGGVVTIVHPESLSFEDYLKTLAASAGASGLLGVGRGIHAAAGAGGVSGGAGGEHGEPGDPDMLAHLPTTHPDDVPLDEGDVGGVVR